MANFKKFTVAYKCFSGKEIISQGIRVEMVHSEEFAFSRVEKLVREWNKRTDKVSLSLVSAE